MELGQIDLSTFRTAINSLGKALHPPPKNDRERDGAIQRFEYTFELAWKSSARVLAAYGLQAASPRATIRELGAQGWIANPKAWIRFLEARNQTVHNYNEKNADAVYEVVPLFYTEAQNLCKTLESNVKG